MFQNNLNLTANEILEKEFKIDTRGYRLKEVDQYLDLIISDYNTFIDIIKKQEKEKEDLNLEISKLKQIICILDETLSLLSISSCVVGGCILIVNWPI